RVGSVPAAWPSLVAIRTSTPGWISSEAPAGIVTSPWTKYGLPAGVHVCAPLSDPPGIVVCADATRGSAAREAERTRAARTARGLMAGGMIIAMPTRPVAFLSLPEGPPRVSAELG